MARIHLLTPTVIPRDAITHDLLGMMRWLRHRNYEAYAYAENRHDALRAEVLPAAAYEQHVKSREDLLIYHHSVAWPMGVRLFERTRNRKILKYHSITPARFFRPYCVQYARDCEAGVKQTALLLRLGPDGVLADSEFNRQEIIRAGHDPASCQTLPPFHVLAATEPTRLDESLAQKLRGGLNLLFVGRVVPNKGHVHLIRALAYCRHKLGLPARLLIVGSIDPALSAYLAELKQLVAGQGLQKYVLFAGSVSAQKLRTFYALASAFICASEHEGFCVPLVEAMHHQVPIVSFGRTAVPFTLGADSLVWNIPAPGLLAESINLLHRRPEVRALLAQRQYERYLEMFTAEAIAASFARAMAPWLQ